jgi:predicted esterase
MTSTARRPALSIARLFLAILLTSGCAPASHAAVQEETFGFTAFSIKRVTLAQDPGASVRYYLSPPAHKAPLVLYIQGSGCVPPFVGLGTAQRYSTLYSWLPLASQRRYAVMAVDKPNQSEQPQNGNPGSAEGCAGDFNTYFSYDSWLATLKKAVRHALSQPDVDKRRVLVLGISEGAVMAAGLAREIPEVTHVALIGAAGPSQLYDFAANIYRTGDSDDAKLTRLQELDDIYRAIGADPTSTGKFAWGHTYRRWSSFFAQSAADNLAHSKARVYLASGMQDNSVPILSTEVLYAQLRTQGRDVTFRRVPSAGHNLAPQGRPISETQKEFDAIMGWFGH